METHFPFVELFADEDLTPLVEAHDSTIRSAKEKAEELLEEVRANLRRAFE